MFINGSKQMADVGLEIGWVTRSNFVDAAGSRIFRSAARAGNPLYKCWKLLEIRRRISRAVAAKAGIPVLNIG